MDESDGQRRDHVEDRSKRYIERSARKTPDGREKFLHSPPHEDSRATYDYTGGEVTRPGLVSDLRNRVSGDVRFDGFSRQLYATDASAYEVLPVGVVYPTSTADVASVLEYCSLRDIPVLPRGGGTSLAGQAVNEAVVLDFTRYMDGFLTVDTTEKQVRAQPGITLGELNAALADDGLKFAPDPAWGDKSTLGGAIGNNSTGAHSLQYGKTDAYIEEVEAVLADGTVTRFGSISLDELRAKASDDELPEPERRVYAAVRDIIEERETIEEAYPDLKRNVSGYNLDRLVTEAQDGEVNLARLLAGSEGTLAIVTEATVTLEPVPVTKSVALLRYDTVADAMADVEPILEHDPAAVEVLDDVLLDLARENDEFGPLVEEMVPRETGAVLLVEFYAESDKAGQRKTERLLEERVGNQEGKIRKTESPVSDELRATDSPVSDVRRRATGGSEAHEPDERERFWKLRKSGLPLLLSRTTDAKHISFVEDVAVEPAALPGFVAEFQELLEENDTFASFYGHAGPGCLHVRPLVNTRTETGIEQMQAIADGVADLAVKYEGSVAGEHGDGRARTQYNRHRYGQRVWALFRDLKEAFDPGWLLNPGQVCGYADDEPLPDGTPERARIVQLTENLRFSPEYEADLGFEPQLSWKNDNGMQGMVELCHGCGGCRGLQETTGGVMCPTYRAADEEITSTRGRANALRQAIRGELPENPTSEEFMNEVMELCIGCKGCARDCPSGVDVAKLKAELQYRHHEEGATTLRDRLFANVDRVSALGSTLAPLPRLLQRLPGSGFVAEEAFGIARERTLPEFRRETLVDWADEREPGISVEESDRRVLLFPDTYTNYSNPDVGRAAVTVLEAAGVHVRLADDVTASGRAAFSKGFLETARERARQNVDALAPAVEDGWDVVVVEPSDAVMFQDEYRDLLEGTDAARVATNTYGIMEYLDSFELDSRIEFDTTSVPSDTTSNEATNEQRATPATPSDDDAPTLIYHGHCHQKSTGRDHHTTRVLRRAGYEVDALDSSCCGMAGSFGYEAEHYSMSEAIATILDRQVQESRGELVVAPGASCRTQIGDLVDADGKFDGNGRANPPHPVELLAASLPPE